MTASKASLLAVVHIVSSWIQPSASTVHTDDTLITDLFPDTGQFACLSIYTSVCLHLCLPMHLFEDSFCLSGHLSDHPFVAIRLCLDTYVCLPIRPSACLSIYLPVYLSIHRSVSTCPSVCPTFCLSVCQADNLVEYKNNFKKRATKSSIICKFCNFLKVIYPHSVCL